MYDNVTIYYFSGTGNALTAGRWIAEKAGQRGIQTDLIAIDRFRKIEVPKAGGRPFWKFSCESCMRCLNVCPRKAIQVSHLLAVLIGVGGSYLPLALVYKAIDPGLPAALYGPVNIAVNWGLYLSLIFLVSGLAWWLIRLKPFNSLLTYTSLTKYWRHYTAPGVGTKDFKRVD